MTSTPFFLTPRQSDDAGRGVGEDTLELRGGAEAGMTVKRLERGLGCHSAMILNDSFQSCQISKGCFHSIDSRQLS